MGSTQLYSLTWGEFSTSLVSAVQLLRCHGDLVDVTLAAGGRSFPAHKIVLCAASPFLLNLLKSTPCKHPVVMLAGVTAPDLEALLEFVYRGEVSVDSSQLPSLLQAAHCLNIQGLAPGTINAEKPEELTTSSASHEALTREVINSFLPIRRRKRTKARNLSESQSKWPRQEGMMGDNLDQSPSGTMPLNSDHDVLSITDVPRKSEDVDTNSQPEDAKSSHTSSSSTINGCAVNPSSSPSGGTGEGATSKKSGGGGPNPNNASDQPTACPLCGAMLRQSRNLRRHLELLHFGVGRSTLRVRTCKVGSSTAGQQSQSQSQSQTQSQSQSQQPQQSSVASRQQQQQQQVQPQTRDQLVHQHHSHVDQEVDSAHESSAMNPSRTSSSELRSSTSLAIHPVSQPDPSLQQQQQQHQQQQQQQMQAAQLMQMVQMAPAAAQAHLLAQLPSQCQPQSLAPSRRSDDLQQAHSSLASSLLPPPSHHSQQQRHHHHHHHVRQSTSEHHSASESGERATPSCEPLSALGCLLPPMPSPHDVLFRQHHAELLRGVGAGLYGDTRSTAALPPTGLPPPQSGRSNASATDMRQQAV